MKIKPLLDFLHVRKVSQETELGGIILPGELDQKGTLIVEVLAISDEIEDCKVAVGNHVISYALGLQQIYNREDEFLVKIDDIFAGYEE